MDFKKEHEKFLKDEEAEYKKLSNDVKKKENSDTVIFPAHKDGFESIFLKKRMWYHPRISIKMINQIKYIAIYEAFPVCSINYYAKIKNIEYVQNKGKYCFYLSGKPIKIKPIIFEKNHMTFRGFKYTKLKTLLKAKRMSDI